MLPLTLLSRRSTLANPSAFSPIWRLDSIMRRSCSRSDADCSVWSLVLSLMALRISLMASLRGCVMVPIDSRFSSLRRLASTSMSWRAILASCSLVVRNCSSNCSRWACSWRSVCSRWACNWRSVCSRWACTWRSDCSRWACCCSARCWESSCISVSLRASSTCRAVTRRFITR